MFLRMGQAVSRESNAIPRGNIPNHSHRRLDFRLFVTNTVYIDGSRPRLRAIIIVTARNVASRKSELASIMTVKAAVIFYE